MHYFPLPFGFQQFTLTSPPSAFTAIPDLIRYLSYSNTSSIQYSARVRHPEWGWEGPPLLPTDLGPILRGCWWDWQVGQNQKACCNSCRLHLLLSSYLGDLSFCHRRKLNWSLWFSFFNAMLGAVHFLQLYWMIENWLLDAVFWCLS